MDAWHPRQKAAQYHIGHAESGGGRNWISRERHAAGRHHFAAAVQYCAERIGLVDCRTMGKHSNAKEVRYKLLSNGTIAALKVGRMYRIPKVHVLTYLRILNTASKV